MFCFPYLSLSKRGADTLRWSSFMTLLLVKPAFPPLMACCRCFLRSGSPGWHLKYIVVFLIVFPCCQVSPRESTSCPSISLARNLCFAPVSTALGWSTPTQQLRGPKGPLRPPRIPLPGHRRPAFGGGRPEHRQLPSRPAVFLFVPGSLLLPPIL